MIAWDTALVTADTGRSYGETRYAALDLISERLHTLVLALRRTTARVISLRKSNRDVLFELVHECKRSRGERGPQKSLVKPWRRHNHFARFISPPNVANMKPMCCSAAVCEAFVR